MLIGVPEGLPFAGPHADAEIEDLLATVLRPTHPAPLEARVDDVLAGGLHDAAADRKPSSSEVGVSHACTVAAEEAHHAIDDLPALRPAAKAPTIVAQRSQQRKMCAMFSVGKTEGIGT